MDKENLKFSRDDNREFYNTLRKRVNQYFETNKITKYGDGRSIFKAVFMLLLYFIPFGIMLSGIVTMPILVLGLWFVMGLAIAGIGMAVMHDANHGSFSKSKFLNDMMGNTLNLLGGNASLWRMQHNTLHHTFTNIDGVDEDINGRSFLRFSPHQPVKKMNRYQHIYAWGFYTLLTLNWVMVSDFFRVFRYREKGLIKNEKALRKEVMQLLLWKAFYYAYAIVLPILVVPVAPWVIIVGFLIMHMVAGFILSVVFQMAHVMTDAEYPLPDENNTLPNSWAIHQIETTINFAPKSKVISWLVGGLNFQIEHHLFSNISHVHYKKLSVIVEATAKEYGVAYRSHPTFAHALREHTRMLKQLGRGYVAEQVKAERVPIPA